MCIRDSKSTLTVDGTAYEIFRLDAVDGQAKLPYSLKVLLENLLRNEDGANITKADIAALASWDPASEPDKEIQFTPARVIMQDFTGVPCVVDLATMREAVAELGGDPAKVNPLSPAELVIDHSVIADVFGTPDAFERNVELEYERNVERYQFLRWGQTAFDDFKVVPPGTGIVHQVNIEHLARVIFPRVVGGVAVAYPDTLVGTDSHTTMVNGLGVVGWGVGGIEAEACMLGQPISMLIPEVLGFKLTGRLPGGATATDLVLTITERLRKHGVVGKFVEFYGPGLEHLSIADRATLSNMCPEYGATIAIFPIDEGTLDYLRLTGRDERRVGLVEAYAKAQGLFLGPDSVEADYAERVELDLATIEPCLAGPRRPQDLVRLGQAKASFDQALATALADRKAATPSAAEGADGTLATAATAIAPGLEHGSVVIAAITSCTNTSNPSVMIGAGLLAKKAVERGLASKPWVKTSLAPGSRVVTDYFDRAGLTPYLNKLGFDLVGYGCTTCIGNSGPLIPQVSAAVIEGGLTVCSVLSGNRNFEGRIHAETQMNFLTSPPLVIAYALAGTMHVDLPNDPLGLDGDGQPVYLRDIWPTTQEIKDVVEECLKADMFTAGYATVFDGDENWRGLAVPSANMFAWEAASTYVRQPPYFEGMPREPEPLRDVVGARVLALLGDSVTTDHISPAGTIQEDSPAGRYLIEQGVSPKDFNSYGSRRGNHEVMVRGTFANIRLRNQLVPGVEGGFTRHLPGGEQGSIYDVAMDYARDGVPLIVLAGAEYGSGSSRDWAAKGTLLLGVKAVLATSYERIHRSNLIGMGVLPLQFKPGDSAQNLGLTGGELYSITGLENATSGENAELPGEVTVWVDQDGQSRELTATIRIDTPAEAAYFRHGGILPYVLRQLLAD